MMFNGKTLAVAAEFKGGGTGESAQDAVLYTAQNLTEAQKTQARKNIGAAAIGSGGGSLSADIVNDVFVVTFSGGLSASIQDGVLVVA